MNQNKTYIDKHIDFECFLIDKMKRKNYISAKRVGSNIKIVLWDTAFFDGKRKKDTYKKKKGGEKRQSSLARARQQVFDLVEVNINAYEHKPIFLTLTFEDKDNSLEMDIANEMFTNFVRKFKAQSGLEPKYVCVPEFQKRGTPHYHIVFFNLPFIFVSNEAREKLKTKKSEYEFNWNDIWSHGDVDVKLIKNKYTNKFGKVIHNGCAAYMSKYLSKKFQDERLYGKKTYFASRKLFRPYKMFSELNHNTYDETMSTLYIMFGVDKKVETNFVNQFEQFVILEGKDFKGFDHFQKKYSGQTIKIFDKSIF